MAHGTVEAMTDARRGILASSGHAELFRRDPADQRYLPRLDGLRAISILLVLVEHFLWNGHGVGGLGVTIFFVISGYLITSILLSYAATLSVREAALKFYWRRMLRLSPPYYLCIAVLVVLKKSAMRDTWLVNALYLTNVKIALDGAWNPSSHFWSLAAEEQFYLVWFLVVVVVARRFLIKIILLFIAVAPVSRGVMFSLTGSLFAGLLLPGVMDSLATGALFHVLSSSLSRSGQSSTRSACHCWRCACA